MFILDEDLAGKEYCYRVIEAKEVAIPFEGSHERTTVKASPYMMPAFGDLEEVAENSAYHEFVWKVIRSGENEKQSVDEATVNSWIPIMNDKGDRCIAVLKAKLKVDEEEAATPSISKIANTVESAIIRAMQEPGKGTPPGSKKLEAETVDETARRELLFPKLMLTNLREVLSRLSSKSISELKSYKRPPITIYRIVKGVLYLFGKKPREVKSWNDIIKFVNQQLLDTMIAYDPTAVQKKIRFKRLSKILKSRNFLFTY
jgi:hypothetical protein